jgi:hypothetical protein
MRVPGGWVRGGYFAVVFLFDVGEECGVGEVPFAAGTSELAFRFFFGFDDLLVVASAFLFAH